MFHQFLIVLLLDYTHLSMRLKCGEFKEFKREKKNSKYASEKSYY